MDTEFRMKDPDSRSSDHNPNEIEFKSDQDLAAHVTSKLFMSTGMSRSISLFWSYFEKQWRSSVEIISDKADNFPAACRSLLILGSPVNNNYLISSLPSLGQEYPILREFDWNKGPHGIVLGLPDGTKLTSSISMDNNYSGTDYAFVARFPAANSGRTLVIIAACAMWGTWGAAEFLLDYSQLKNLPNPARMPGNPMAFVLEIEVFNGHPTAVKICKAEDGTPRLFSLLAARGRPQYSA